MKKLHKLILLVILLLGYSINTSAQDIQAEKIFTTKEILKRNVTKTVFLTFNDFSDTSSVNTNVYKFRIEEPLYLSFEVDYSFFITEIERTPEKLKCQFTVESFNWLSNKVYYQKSRVVDPKSLSSLNFADTLLLPSGLYRMVLTMTEEEKNTEMTPSDNGVEAISALMAPPTVQPIDPHKPIKPVPPPIDPFPPVVPKDSLGPLLESYIVALHIQTEGVFSEEQPMPAIPSPVVPSDDDGLLKLRNRMGKNAVSVFKSRTGLWDDGTLVVNYYDGLGRPEQTIQQGMSPNHKDLVTLQEYDGWGRKSNTWLPAVATQGAGDFIDADSCGKLARSTYGGDLYPYSSFDYENSPLEKVTRQHNPGKVWRDHGRSVVMNECVNIAGNDTLGCFSFQVVNGARDTINVIAGKQYESGSLFVVRTEDEDGATLFEFKDRLERTVLERRRESRVNGSKQIFDTYYVYDDYGKLCAVLPPALSDRLTVGAIPAKELEKYAYLYKYDIAGNVMAKKRPGISWEYYVYNVDNFLLFSQNGKERKRGEWKFYLPDVFNRVCLQGICKNTINPFNGYYLNSWSTRFICKYTGCTEYGGYEYEYDLRSILHEPLIQIINYYDNYNFLYRTDLSSRDELKYVCEEGFASTASSAKGMLTGTSRLLSDAYDQYRNGGAVIAPKYNHSVTYYDDRGRLSQTVSDNHLGGLYRDFFSYDFNGKALRHLHRQTGANNDTLSNCYTYSYDHAERLVKVVHRIGDGPEVVLVNNTYDDLGRLSAKTFHNDLLNTSYSYNIRSWLTGITGSSFEQVLHYTDGPGVPQYGGNISSMAWKSGDGDVSKGYCFDYDGMGRLTHAKYGEGNVLSQNPNRFNEQVTGYDKMGNILGIKRFGRISATGYSMIDDLAMDYNGNQLKSVSDSSVNPVYGNGFDFKDGANAETEYEYDENGNMTKDLNKNISNIQYNSLNLPDRVEFENGNVFSYVYDAEGTKLRTIHVIGNDTTVTDYCASVIYENGTPVMLLTEAGYVTLGDRKYHYFVQDHQGNNRVVVDQDGAIEEVNHYYPFGGLMASSTNTVQSYKYNGKELDRKGGLDWYDYGARHYDATIGRWHVVDPMGEKYYNWSPYAYCKNSPVLRIDPDGKDDYVVGNDGKLTRIGEKTDTDVLYKFSGNQKNPKGKRLVTMKEQGLLAAMVDVQDNIYNDHKPYGKTNNIEDAANLFQSVAENTGVEWKLNIYNSDGTYTAVIATDKQPNRVQNGEKAKRDLGVQGQKVLDIHSHPDPEGTKGGADKDFNNVDPKSKNLVYFQANRTLYEYNRKQSNIGATQVAEGCGIYDYIKKQIMHGK